LPEKYFYLKKKIFLSEKFVRATTTKFGPKVLKLEPKAAFNSPPQELEEGARSAPYLLVLQILLFPKSDMWCIFDF
jgi:hypothetical protein